MNIKTIKRAVLENRGGLENATDSQIRIIWNSLPADVQKQYLEKIKNQKSEKGEKKSASSNKTKSDI